MLSRKKTHLMKISSGWFLAEPGGCLMTSETVRSLTAPVHLQGSNAFSALPQVRFFGREVRPDQRSGSYDSCTSALLPTAPFHVRSPCRGGPFPTTYDDLELIPLIRLPGRLALQGRVRRRVSVRAAAPMRLLTRDRSFAFHHMLARKRTWS